MAVHGATGGRESEESFQRRRGGGRNTACALQTAYAGYLPRRQALRRRPQRLCSQYKKSTSSPCFRRKRSMVWKRGSKQPSRRGGSPAVPVSLNLLSFLPPLLIRKLRRQASRMASVSGQVARGRVPSRSGSQTTLPPWTHPLMQLCGRPCC